MGCYWGGFHLLDPLGGLGMQNDISYSEKLLQRVGLYRVLYGPLYLGFRVLVMCDYWGL